MEFPKLTVPLQVEFGSDHYWLMGKGPYEYGAATTAFFADELQAEANGDLVLLMRRMEDVIYNLYPDCNPSEAHMHQVFEPSDVLEPAAECLVQHVIRKDDSGELVIVEQITFQCLQDFLYMELCRGFQRGNAPRECRLCKRWFLHLRGAKYVYCDRPAPGETERTCRDIGAAVSFEQKLKANETWLIYKRAYKKYYARLMKKKMTREEFETWADEAAMERDRALTVYQTFTDEHSRTNIAGKLRDVLNQK